MTLFNTDSNFLELGIINNGILNKAFIGFSPNSPSSTASTVFILPFIFTLYISSNAFLSCLLGNLPFNNLTSSCITSGLPSLISE